MYQISKLKVVYYGDSRHEPQTKISKRVHKDAKLTKPVHDPFPIANTVYIQARIWSITWTEIRTKVLIKTWQKFRPKLEPTYDPKFELKFWPKFRPRFGPKFEAKIWTVVWAKNWPHNIPATWCCEQVEDRSSFLGDYLYTIHHQVSLLVMQSLPHQEKNLKLIKSHVSHSCSYTCFKYILYIYLIVARIKSSTAIDHSLKRSVPS